MCSDAHTLLLLEVGARDRKRSVRFPGGAGIRVGSWALIPKAGRCLSHLHPHTSWFNASRGIRHSQHSDPTAALTDDPELGSHRALWRGAPQPTERGGVNWVGVCPALLPTGHPPSRELCLLRVVCDKNSSPGQPSTALMPALVKDLRYLPQKKKIKERKWKNRRKNPQAIPIFDLFPAASTDLTQGSTAPHRAPHSTSGVSSLPWQPAQDGAVTLREPYLKGSKTLQGKCQKREVSVQDIPALKTEPQRQQ